MKKKPIIISALLGIYFSLVFYVSINFPPIVSNLPLASVDARPQNTFSRFLDNVRCALDAGYGIEQTLTALLLTGFIYFTLTRLWPTDYTRKPTFYILGLLFGIVNTAGLCMYWTDSLPMFTSVSWLIGTLLLAIGWGGIFCILMSWLFWCFDHMKLFAITTASSDTAVPIKYWIQKHFWFFSFVIILLGWLPWIISYYPASMDNDVFHQFWSVLEYPNNHHPYFSSCVLVYCYKIGKWLVSENFGVFIYVLFRDVLLAIIYSKCIDLQKRMGFKPIIYYGFLIFYAFTPVWGAYAKHAFKDTFCAGLFCLYILSLIKILQQIKHSSPSYSQYLTHGLAALFLSLFRNNCIYVILPITICFTFYILLKKRTQIKGTLLVILCVSLYFGYNNFITTHLNVIPSESKEALSLVYQATARIARDHGNELTEEEIAGISAMFDYNRLSESYNPILSDPVKNDCLILSENRGLNAQSIYIQTWIKLFRKYPITYLESAIAQSYGYYSFVPNQPEQSGNWNSGMTIFDWIGCNSGYNESFSFHYINHFDDARQVLQAWAKVWDKIPVLSITNICAFYTWIIIALFYYLLTKKLIVDTLPLLAMGIMILTCIASPVNDCFRYYCSIAASFPAILLLLPSPRN